MDSVSASHNESTTGTDQEDAHHENLATTLPEIVLSLGNKSCDDLNLDSQIPIDEGAIDDRSNNNNNTDLTENYTANSHKHTPQLDEVGSVSEEVSVRETSGTRFELASQIYRNESGTLPEETSHKEGGRSDSSNIHDAGCGVDQQCISAVDSQTSVHISTDNEEIKAFDETNGSHEDVRNSHQGAIAKLTTNDGPLASTTNGDSREKYGLSESVDVQVSEDSETIDKGDRAECNTDTDPFASSSNTGIVCQDLHTDTNGISGSILNSIQTVQPSGTSTHALDPNIKSTPAKDIQYIASSSKDVCPFSEQPICGTISADHLADTRNGNTSAIMAVPDISPSDQSASFEGTERDPISLTKHQILSSTSNDSEDTSKNSSASSKEFQQNGEVIKNVFQRPSLPQASTGSDRSGSPGSNNGDNEDEGDIVLVTGGCGFLGQHVVKMLHLRAPHVAEIRVLDLTYFEKKLDYQTNKRMKSMVGDISNAEFVNKALKGVHSVIHLAGIVSWGTFPDYGGMEKVNVKGTLNVLNGCLKNNVQRLIYCSTVDVAVGNKPIRGGTEENTPVPDNFLFPGYPETKYHGERIVLGLGQYKGYDGSNLQAVILRPNVLYGELDKFYVTTTLRMAKQSMGILYKIGNGKAMFQQSYVGNTAWAFVCADTAMKGNPELTKEIFYVPDNTPVQNSFNFMVPYLEAQGLKLSDGYLSYALSHSAVAAAELFARALSPLVKLHLPVQSCTIAYINTDLYFRGEKAKAHLNYEPIYSSNEAREMSMKYYAKLDLEDKHFGSTSHEQR